MGRHYGREIQELTLRDSVTRLDTGKKVTECTVPVVHGMGGAGSPGRRGERQRPQSWVLSAGAVQTCPGLLLNGGIPRFPSSAAGFCAAV